MAKSATIELSDRYIAKVEYAKAFNLVTETLNKIKDYDDYRFIGLDTYSYTRFWTWMDYIDTLLTFKQYSKGFRTKGWTTARTRIEIIKKLTKNQKILAEVEKIEFYLSMVEIFKERTKGQPYTQRP